MKFEKIDITKENINPFQRIGQDWMLISAEREGKVNTMTASWGMMGVFWGKNVVTVGIRPQRFTKEFVDAGEFFTLTFFDGERKEEMGYLGGKLPSISNCALAGRKGSKGCCSISGFAISSFLLLLQISLFCINY